MSGHDLDRQWLIASEEKKKFQRETLARLGTGRLLNTPGILILAISEGAITVEEADHGIVLDSKSHMRQ